MERLPGDVQWLIFGRLIIQTLPAGVEPLALCPHVQASKRLRYIYPHVDGELGRQIAGWCAVWPCLVPMFRRRTRRMGSEFTFVTGVFAFNTMLRLTFPEATDYEMEQLDYKSTSLN